VGDMLVILVSICVFAGIGKVYFENGLGRYYTMSVTHWCECCKSVFTATLVVGCSLLEIFAFEILGYLSSSVRLLSWEYMLIAMCVCLNLVIPVAMSYTTASFITCRLSVQAFIVWVGLCSTQVGIWLVGHYMPLRTEEQEHHKYFVASLLHWSLQENIIRLSAIGTCVAALLSGFAAVSFPLDLYLMSKYAAEVSPQDLSEGEQRLMETLVMVESRKERLHNCTSIVESNGHPSGIIYDDRGGSLRHTHTSRRYEDPLHIGRKKDIANTEIPLLEQICEDLRNDVSVLRRFQEQSVRDQTILGRVEKVSGLALTLWGIFRVCLGVFRVLLRVAFVTGGGIVLYRAHHISHRNDHINASFPTFVSRAHSFEHAAISTAPVYIPQETTSGMQTLRDGSRVLHQDAFIETPNIIPASRGMEAAATAYLLSWVPLVYVATVAVLVVMQVRGFLQSVQQLAKLGFIFSGTEVYSLILAFITGCYFLACLLLLRVTSKQIIESLPVVVPNTYGDNELHNVTESEPSVYKHQEMLLSYSLREGSIAINRAFGQNINYDFFFWLFDACFVTSTMFFSAYLWVDFHQKKKSIYSFMKNSKLVSKRSYDRLPTLSSRSSPLISGRHSYTSANVGLGYMYRQCYQFLSGTCDIILRRIFPPHRSEALTYEERENFHIV